MASLLLERVRAFLVNAPPPWRLLTGFADFLRHVTHNIFHFRVTHLLTWRPPSTMATMRRDSRTDDQPAAELRKMIHLKTKEECRLGNETIQVWTVELPSKHAEGILRAIKDNVPGQDSVDLQHLRRFAKPKYLPAHVLGKRDLVKEMYNVPRAWEATPSTVMQAPATTAWEYSAPVKGRANGRPSTLHLLVCPTRIMDLRTLHNILSQFTPFSSSADSWAYPLEIKEITVPLLAPTSPKQANTWSEEYWPTFYRKTNPFGAHPASIEKAENELHNPQEDNTSVDEALALAERAGDEALRRGIGAGTGAVIMERVDGQTQIIAVAGDARHKPQANAAANDPLHPCCQGSPMGHAIMRAVGMVGRKRLRCASQPVTKAAAKAESNFTRGGLEHDTHARDAFFLDLPITPMEEEYFKKDNLKPDGYLCLKLEVFLTHEPCMMCSMALVHSRVGRVIFKNRMPQTGGLTAELVRNDSGPVGLGYGLCWRKELNWQFMCWEYMRTDEQGTIERQDLRKDSTEKYQEAEDIDGGELANVHSNSFARMHV